MPEKDFLRDDYIIILKIKEKIRSGREGISIEDYSIIFSLFDINQII